MSETKIKQGKAELIQTESDELMVFYVVQYNPIKTINACAVSVLKRNYSCFYGQPAMQKSWRPLDVSREIYAKPWVFSIYLEFSAQLW